jgi:hypothetical protein
MVIDDGQQVGEVCSTRAELGDVATWLEVGRRWLPAVRSSRPRKETALGGPGSSEQGSACLAVGALVNGGLGHSTWLLIVNSTQWRSARVQQEHESGGKRWRARGRTRMGIFPWWRPRAAVSGGAGWPRRLVRRLWPGSKSEKWATNEWAPATLIFSPIFKISTNLQIPNRDLPLLQKYWKFAWGYVWIFWTTFSVGSTSNSWCNSCDEFWKRFKFESPMNFEGVQTCGKIWEILQSSILTWSSQPWI